MKTEAQLAEIDAWVHAAVAGGARRMARILSCLAQEGVRLDDRAVDRSLQRLRQRGELIYESKIGWSPRT